MISWGDAAYYVTSDKSLGLALRALSLPTQAAINVRPLHDLNEVPQTMGEAKLYALNPDTDQLEEMFRVIRSALLNETVAVQKIQSDNNWVGGDFYAAHDRRYSLLYTCNNWVAEVLRAGGLPFSPIGSQLSAGLIAQHRVG